MKGLRRFFLGLTVAAICFGGLIALCVAVISTVYLDPERLSRELSAMFGRKVEIDGTVDLAIWGDLRLAITQLNVSNPEGSAFRHLVEIHEISVGLRWWDLPRVLVGFSAHVFDVALDGGKVHVDSRQDVVGDDGVWPSADDPFTGLLGWINTLQGRDLHVEVQADKKRIRKIVARGLRASFGTGEAGAVIIDAEQLDLTVSGIPAKGSLRLDAPIVTPGSAPPATLSGKLQIEEIKFGAGPKQPASTGIPFRLDRALPQHICRSWDTDLELAVGTVQVSQAEVTDIQLSLRSSKGEWKVHLTNANLPAGSAQADLSLQCGKLPGQLEFHSHVASKGKSEFGQSGATVSVQGRMESVLNLAGKGSTWKELVGDLSGHFSIFLGPVETEGLDDHFYSRSLFHALTVSWGQSKKADVDCAVFDMKIKNGVARSNQIVIGTPTLVIDGHGEIELLENKVEIVLIPHAKHPHVGRLHAPVLVSGPIQNPEINVDWMDVVPRIGIETATSVVAQVLRSLPFRGLRKEERAACLRSLEPGEMLSAPRGG